jgi:hypothetical protein
MHVVHVFRVSKYNCFVGKFDSLPGIHEFQCLRVETTDMRAFEKKMKSLGVNNQEEYKCITASIELGTYCIRRFAFVDCVLHYELPRDEQQFHHQDPPSCKRQCFQQNCGDVRD